MAGNEEYAPLQHQVAGCHSGIPSSKFKIIGVMALVIRVKKQTGTTTRN